MSWTEIEIDASGNVTVRRGGTLTGDTGTRSGDTLQPLLERLAETGEIEPEPKPMAEPEPKSNPLTAGWGGPVWQGPYKQPVGSVQQLPEPEPKIKMVTWRLCVPIGPTGIDGKAIEPSEGFRFVRWYPSGDIPKHWYPIESYEQPIETVKRLPEGQEP